MRAQIQNAFELIGNRQQQDALAILDNIAGETTDDSEALVMRAQLAMQLGRLELAISSLERAVELQPGDTATLLILADVLEKTGQVEAATEQCQRVLGADEGAYQARLILGRLAMRNADYVAAVSHLQAVLAQHAEHNEARVLLIRCLRHLHRHDDAFKHAQELLEREPSAFNHLPMARVLIEQGRTDEAVAYLQRAIAIDNTCGYAYQDLATIKKFSREDNELIEQAEIALRQNAPVQQRALIQFSLGKVYDDREQWQQAFDCYRKANRLLRPQHEPGLFRNHFERAQRAYPPALLQQADVYGSDSELPVFVVGMPRSGTTLIEQIIASHPQAAGAGELHDIARIHIAISPASQAEDVVPQLSAESLKAYAETYLATLRRQHARADRVVDKFPDNYLYLGLIAKLFPRARIIHAQRHPLDCCLSCFFQPFEHLPETTDLEWLGRRYRLYREAMAYWRQQLPVLNILDVNYEDLVTDSETQIRRIIDFCGLPWDDRCIQFQHQAGPIVTASVWQARQQVYTHSRQRWLHYAAQLGPLAAQLQDYLDDSDRAELARHGVRLKAKPASRLLGWLRK